MLFGKFRYILPMMTYLYMKQRRLGNFSYCVVLVCKEFCNRCKFPFQIHANDLYIHLSSFIYKSKKGETYKLQFFAA